MKRAWKKWVVLAVGLSGLSIDALGSVQGAAAELARESVNLRESFRAMTGDSALTRGAEGLGRVARELSRQREFFALVGNYERVDRQFVYLRRAYRAAPYLKGFPHLEYDWRAVEGSFLRLRALMWRMTGGKGMIDLYGDE